jgi:gentisate 1,2-dioxygenase
MAGLEVRQLDYRQWQSLQPHARRARSVIKAYEGLRYKVSLYRPSHHLRTSIVHWIYTFSSFHYEVISSRRHYAL